MESGQSSFPNPTEPSLPVYGLLDVAHMIKLLRNSLANYGALIDSEGGQIQWKYIEQLHQLQLGEGFRFGTKIRKKHHGDK